jgi:hypothetical protein
MGETIFEKLDRNRGAAGSGRAALNLLRVFDVVWRHGHLGLASEELELSQPALSHALRRLREKIGDPFGMRSVEDTPVVHPCYATRLVQLRVGSWRSSTM